MKIYASLYAFVWVTFFEIAFVLLRFYGYRDLVHAHLILGIALIFWAQFNAMEVAKTEAPARTKRISRTVVGMSVGSAVTGIILYLPYLDIDIGIHDFVCGLVFIHILFAFAMFTQSASVATSYDMWEEKEFGPEPEPLKRSTPQPFGSDSPSTGAGDEEAGGRGAGIVIAFIGLLVLVVGLILYLYSEGFQIGFLISTVYPHRDLGTVLIPTGIAIMFAGIVLHTVRKRPPSFVERNTSITQGSYSPSLSDEEKLGSKPGAGEKAEEGVETPKQENAHRHPR